MAEYEVLWASLYIKNNKKKGGRGGDPLQMGNDQRKCKVLLKDAVL
jgi:hypothetical protein